MNMKNLAAAACCLILLLAGCQRVEKAVKRALDDPGKAKPAQVSLNKLPLANPDSQPMRFLVIGHGYGGTTLDDHLPDQALLAKLPELEALDLSMLVSLGDIVQHSSSEDFDNLERSLLAPLSVPVFNVPGNHDVEDRGAYQARFGQTSYSFRAGPAQMIFLDTEREHCAIDAAQQKMLAKVLDAAVRDRKVENIFIFMHKTLFFDNQALIELNQSQGLPNVAECIGNEQFPGILQDRLLPAAQKKPIYLFAGDVGAWGNLTPYYEKRGDAALTLLATGLGDSPNDAGILVSVDGATVELQAYSLTGQPVLPLEQYTPQYWLDTAGE